MTHEFKKLVSNNATGTAAIGIKAAKFKNLPVPFPPILEQEEIAQRILIVFNLVSNVEESLKALKISRLPKKLFSRAFQGQIR